MFNLKDWATARRIKRLEADLKMIRNKIRFNPFNQYSGLNDYETAENFTERIQEYKIWASGSARAIREFYHTGSSSGKETPNTINYFWKKAPNGIRMLHTGIPGLICSKMSTILFGNGMDIGVEVFDENGKVSKEKGKQSKELIDGLFNELDMQQKFSSGAIRESCTGHIFYKFSHKPTLSQYPIFEMGDIANTEIIKERGITKAIIFKYWYKKNNQDYCLNEIYSTNENGYATIQYKLFELRSNQETEVPISTIPEGEKLLIDGNLDNNNTFTYEGLIGMLAFEKPNKKPSLEFPSSFYGASDFEGAVDSFDALDEVYSNIFEELRTNRTARYIPADFIPKDDKGNSILDDDFTNSYVSIVGDADQDSEHKIIISQVNDKTDQHLIKWRTALTTAINKAGLSPFALGITGLESVNSSAESQQERNKTTLETRKQKLKLWKPFIEKILVQAVALNSWMLSNNLVTQPAFSKLQLDFNNTNIQVEFGDYIIDSEKSKIETWSGAKMNKVASTYECVKNIHPDWDEASVDNEVNTIRFEEGMSLDNPDNLPNLNGEDENANS